MNKEVQTQILAAISSLQAKQEELMSHATLLSASKDHGNQSQDIIRFQNDIAQISSKIQEIISRLETCEKQQDDLEQYSRRNCAILHGCSSVPETEYHKFEDFVVKTLNDSLKPNHPIVNTDIDITHKLKSRSPKNPINIKFVRRSTKNMVYEKAEAQALAKILDPEYLNKMFLESVNTDTDEFNNIDIVFLKCRVAQNGGFFNIKYGSSLGNLVSDGRLVLDHGNIQNANFGITKNGTFVVGYITSEDIEKMDFEQLIGGAVWLVRNGSPYVEESFKCESADVQETGTLRTFIDVQSARTAIGHDALGRVVFVNTEGQTKVRGLNLNQFARLLIKEFHLVNAINLDGGGSATLVLNGSLASYPSDHCKSDPEWRCARAVTTIVCAHDPDCETECVHGECIHGKCSCSVNYRGESCEKLYCGHHNCSSHGSCQPEGCDCSPGWHGTDCTIPCGPTHFGKNCSQECRCRNNGTCNSVTGICTCRPGFGGALCEKGCELGTYGSNCQYTCHCANTCTCNPASGVCRNDTSYNLEKYASINVAQCLIKKQQRKSEKIQKTKDFMEFHWMAIMCTTVGALVLSLAFNVYLLLLKSGCTGGYDHHDNHKKAKNVPLDSIPLDQEEDTEADANFIPLQGISLSNHQTTEADANKIALKGIRSSPKRKTKPFSMGNNRIKTKRKSKMPSLKNLVQTFKNKQSHSKEGYTPLNNPNNDESNLEFEETSLL
ncbi:uncharacterized protein LOC144427681 [Styela clava]